ncbi:MAG: alanine--glyoxylate aminotransferase family protein [Bacteroidia bacterium]|nr:alanine--glyoxylate aminotransferase family protein [Bacteroidia bacterium]
MTHLFTPGPVPVPAFVMEAIARPVIHHRTEAFTTLYAGIQTRLQYLFQTKGFTGTIIGSGTYGVESAIYSLFRPGEKVAVIQVGKFSQRWSDYSKLSGLEIIVIEKEWGKGITPQEVSSQLESHSDIAGIVITHCETSTGVCLDLEEIVLAARQQFPDLCILVDAITTVGAIPFYMDQWEIDYAVVASQKALMNPAGTCAFALSERAMGRLVSTHSSDFRNLYNYYQSGKRHEYPFTAPTQLLYGIGAALEDIQSEGLPAIWNRTHHAAKTFREGIIKLDGEIVAEMPSDSLTAFRFPGKNNSFIKKQMAEKYDIHLAGGQGPMKGEIMRCSHMAGMDAEMMLMVLDKLGELVKQKE